MAETKKQKAIRLYNGGFGYPTWKIALLLDTTEAKVCKWVGLRY